ncbi:MAG: DUF1028 domain-containing protein [Solirubrobacteraceae bacterium]
MTFTILGRCERTGQLGVAVTTSDIAVGARVPFAQAGVAVAVTQHRTDPRLGPALLEALRGGASAAGAVDQVVSSTPHREWRQLAVLTAGGDRAAYSGSKLWPIGAELSGADCLVVANMLTGDGVAPAMVAAFERATGELADRLLAALRAGDDAGGETGPLRSAALLVVERESFPYADLRVDDDPEPLRRLERLWATYRPLARQFVARALTPDDVQRSSSTTT